LCRHNHAAGVQFHHKRVAARLVSRGSRNVTTKQGLEQTAADLTDCAEHLIKEH
jgi:hypothetical protein